MYNFALFCVNRGPHIDLIYYCLGIIPHTLSITLQAAVISFSIYLQAHPVLPNYFIFYVNWVVGAPSLCLRTTRKK